MDTNSNYRESDVSQEHSSTSGSVYEESVLSSDSSDISFHGSDKNTFSDEMLLETEEEDREPSKIIIVGTAHVSEKSVREVIETIEKEKPDVVAVELCRSRYETLKGTAPEVSEVPIKTVLSEGKIYLLLIHWLLAYIQKKIGAEVGIQPGAEMISAIEAAEESGARLALVDRDVQITLHRLWSRMGFFEKIRMLGALIGAAVGVGGGKRFDDIDMDDITSQDTVNVLIEELRGISPTTAKVLIDERDAYIASNLLDIARGGGRKIVAVVGAGHRAGIERYLSDPESLPPREQLVVVPKKKINWLKASGIIFALIAIAAFALLILSGTPLNIILIAFGWWFIINGTLSAAGALIARAHPYSVLTAFSVAWLTSLNPMMAAGWFAGLVEAKKRNPTTADFKNMMNIETTQDMMGNNLFRVILVASLANLGSVLGTFLGAYVMIQVAGIDPREVISAGLAGIGL